MAEAGVDAFLVPRADAFQGEYVAPADERLAWLTGFTGSAGLCAVTATDAALFADGRYTLQAKAQVDGAAFTIVPWPRTKPGDWLAKQLTTGATVAFDPWLHTVKDLETLRAAGADKNLDVRPIANLVDAVWADRPDPPSSPFRIHPDALAGESHAAKRARLGKALEDAGHATTVLSLPDNIAWLLNIRGSDIRCNPVPHAFALLHSSGAVDLFADPAKTTGAVRAHLGPDIALATPDAFLPRLKALEGPVLIDPASTPAAVAAALADPDHGTDPILLPKARKNTAELAGMEAAHLRDATALCRFLAWLEAEAPVGTLTEIDVVRRLEAERARFAELRDISFDTICGAGPHGAIVHYRVTEETNARVVPGQLLLIDSGGQYVDGTTDITRTLATGPAPSADETDRFTRVLKGMIAISRARWPKGLAGRDLDALARAALWEAGLDFDHGTGHGVGAALSVHEGPQRLSRASTVPLEPGMVLSNEPGYYRTDAYGIRIENLLHVVPAPALDGADDRKMLAFATLTWVPIDRRLIAPDLLTAPERAWLDTYHAEVAARVGPCLGDGPDDEAVAEWLRHATAPL